MHCMKCGKKTDETQVFCEDCLAVMANYPVRPDTVVQLPIRATAPAKKAAPRKRPLSPEAQLVRTRKTVKRLAMALGCALLALCLSVSFLIHIIEENNMQDTIGKNYSTTNTD